MEGAYTGPQFKNGTIQSLLDSQDIKYKTLDDERLFDRSAEIIADGKVLGWFCLKVWLAFLVWLVY